MLKGLYLRWLEEPSGTPQVLSSTPRGSEFQAEVKKNPLAGPGANALVWMAQVGLRTLTWPRQGSHGLRPPVSGRGQGSGIFSVGEAETSSRKSIPVGRSFPTRPSFFYFSINNPSKICTNF